MGRYPGETTQYKWRRTYDPTPDQVHEIDLEIDRADVGTLMAAIERRSWLDSQMICPRTYYTLSAAQLAAIRARATELVHLAGGRHEIGDVVIRSDGARLWTEMA